MEGASGVQNIGHQSNLLECISGQFNNPDVSDLTLRVHQTSYHVHRSILAFQSSVFSSMLTGEHWVESKERVIVLREDRLCTNSTVSDFLKYFYTRKVTLTCDNVCPLHMLAEKYDVVLLKNACLAFIRDVLEGMHGDSLELSLYRLHYIEQYLPDMLDKCFEVLRNSLFVAGHSKNFNLVFLNVEHMKIILDPKFGNEIVALNEALVWRRVEDWHRHVCHIFGRDPKKHSATLGELLPLIRFNNMSMYDLRELIKKCKCSEKQLKDYVRETYHVESKVYEAILYKSVLRASTETENTSCTCTCSMETKDQSCFFHTCTCAPIDQPCIHTNPRLYVACGELFCFPIDETKRTFKGQMVWPVFDLSSHSKTKHLETSTRKSSLVNSVGWQVNFFSEKEIGDKSTATERFQVMPEKCHQGRAYTIAMYKSISPDMEYDKATCSRGKKVKGVVKRNRMFQYKMNAITFTMPRRFCKESKSKTASSTVATDEDNLWTHWIDVTVILH